MHYYSLDEISRHNNTDDCWIVIDGTVYDVSGWLARHPGGDALAALAGEDNSALFHSSHLSETERLLEPFRIGVVREYQPPFPAIDDTFLRTLKGRVHAYFKDQGIERRDASKNLLSIRLTAAGLFACWAFAYLFPPWGVVGAILMGLATCSLIGSFGHEQIHGNLPGRHGRLADLLDRIRWGLYIPFMPRIYFQYEHLKHHAYPMHPDQDYDVYALKSLVRLSHLSAHRRQHALQHLYAPFVYANYIVLQLIGGYTTPFFDARALLREKTALPHIATSSLVAFAFHLALPIYIAGFSWASICILTYFATWQGAIYITSGLPHMTLGAGRLSAPGSWARYVCDTTVNLKCGHWFCDWLTGGLNYHLAHHLLPSIPRDHLPAVNRIVEDTCAEFGYPCRTYRSFLEYYRDHYQLLRELGAGARPRPRRAGFTPGLPSRRRPGGRRYRMPGPRPPADR